MKKYILLLSMLGIVWGCNEENNEEEWDVDCDAAYKWEFRVKNETSRKEIVITADNYDYPPPYTFVIAPDKDEVIMVVNSMGACNRTTVLEEITHKSYDFRVTPIGIAIIGSNGYLDYNFKMIVNGVEVSNDDDIWLNKHWAFEPNYFNYYLATYTLTVTDELLDSLTPAGRDE